MRTPARHVWEHEGESARGLHVYRCPRCAMSVECRGQPGNKSQVRWIDGRRVPVGTAVSECVVDSDGDHPDGTAKSERADDLALLRAELGTYHLVRLVGHLGQNLSNEQDLMVARLAAAVRYDLLDGDELIERVRRLRREHRLREARPERVA